MNHRIKNHASRGNQTLKFSKKAALNERLSRAVVVTDFDFNILHADYTLLKKYHRNPGKLIEILQVFCVEIENIGFFERKIKSQLLEAGRFNSQLTIAPAIGLYKWLELWAELVFDGEIQRIVWVIDEVFEKNYAGINAKLAAEFFCASSAALLIVDSEFYIIKINSAFVETTGYSLKELSDRGFFSIFDLFANNCLRDDIIQSMNESGTWRGESVVHRKNDDCFSALVLIDRVKQAGADHYAAMILDISESKKLEHELRYHSEIDPLTNLANRKLFFQRLDTTLASAKRFYYNVALMYLDLDGFKQVNDSFGHGKGDEVLIEVAQRLRRCVREVDTVARLGGDEFVIILNGTSKELIADTAQRIINTLTLTVAENNMELQVSASIGIAIYPDDSTNPVALLKYADAAMYRAKFKGKCQYCWHVN